ncbi:2'-5' RNA ligase family protein [Streptomyces desertarenae]|uniref:2'-5' RNA ligase family protein n=1 Tax=Streptomyces desertarenae TaxID=2666184 RepID=A0ABW4PL01_9ACTN
MRTVELLPDDTADRAVREAWRHLAAAGLPSQAGHTHPTNRPHLTLATAEAVPAAARVRVEEALTALPVPFRLAGLVRFEGRVHVLAWAVCPDPELLRLHEAVWRALETSPGTGPLNPLHAPGRWVPHITLGRSRRPVWEVPDGRLLPPSPGGTLRGRFTGARSYDSATRGVDSLSPR